MRSAHYISSTHWDREWYDTFQGFRYRLVGLLDEVLDHLKGDPAYGSFEMDGQVLPVLDYLEVREKSGDCLRQLASLGRFRIGPWYSLPDEWLVSGESLVRNLEVGLEFTSRFGSVRPVSAPLVDEFGHVSQMPQILAQFGFTGTSLHRGINMRDCEANFRWGAPDGSSIMCHRFGLRGYGTLQIDYRRVLEADESFDFQATVARLVQWTLAEAGRTSLGPVLLLDSCDHVEIQPESSAIIAAANETLNIHGINIVHSNFDSYFSELSSALGSSKEVAVKGELRDSARDGLDVDATWLISGVLSSRALLKKANARCEDELCLWAEPFSSFVSHVLGREYPAEFIKLSWRYLLENQAHDSICGCSIDQVHKDMDYRFDQSIGISGRLTNSALREIASGSAVSGLSANKMTLTLFNPTASEITTPSDFVVRLPSTWPEKFQEFFGYEEKFSFLLRDCDGQELPWQLNGQKLNHRCFRRTNRKIPVEDMRHLVDVTAAVNVPAFGYTTLTVEPIKGPVRHLGSLRTGMRSMENEYLYLEVSDDGTVHLRDKESERSYHGLFSYEDGADIGDGWNWAPPVNDEVHVSSGSNWSFAIIADGPEKATFQITKLLSVPEFFDFKLMSRSGRIGQIKIVNKLTLRRRSRALESQIEVENVSSDHRLRVFFPTDLCATSYLSDSAFDVIERPVSLAADNAMRRELDVDGRPQQSWTAVGDGSHGLAVISRGIYESGVLDRTDLPVFLTLLRGFRKAVFSNDNPGGQSLGNHVSRIDLIPFAGSIPIGDLIAHSQRVAAPVRAFDLLPQELPASRDALLPGRQSFFELEGQVVITSVRAEGMNQWTVRFFNPYSRPERFVIGKSGQILSATAYELSGKPETRFDCELKEGRVFGSLPAKAVGTIRLTLCSLPQVESEGLKSR